MDQGPPRFQVIHTVHCRNSSAEDRLYLDQPWVVESGPYNAHLRGSQPINNFELYLERNKEIVFIVYKDYDCCGKSPLPLHRSKNEREFEVDASALLVREQTSIISRDLRLALGDLANTALQGIPHPDFEDEGEISHPYIWYFHRRKEIAAATDGLQPEARRYLDVFHDYIQDRMMDEWNTVDKLLGEKKISAQYMDYLFVSSFKPIRPFPLAERKLIAPRFRIILSYRRKKAVCLRSCKPPSRGTGS